MIDLGSDWLLSFLLGATFVVLYTTARLRGPEADRSFTTLYRYSVSALYFALGHLAVYLLALCVIWAAHRIDRVGIASYLLDSPGWLALITAGLLPRLKPFSILDTVFRSHARQIGGMPDEALSLRDAIVDARLSLPDGDYQEMHFGLLRRGVDVGSQHILPDHTLHAQILQAAQLKYLFDRCVRKRRHFTFACDNQRISEMINRRFDHLMFRASRSIEAIGQLHELANTLSGKSGNWESLGALAENQAYAPETTASAIGPASSTSRMLIANLREDVRYFNSDVALLLARMTLRKRWTERSRVRLLESMGIQVQPLIRPRFRALLPVFGVVAACMASIGLFTASSMSPTEATIAVLMIPLMFVIAVLCAVYPKQYFGFANVNVYGRPPWLFFVAAGISAALLAFVVGLVFRLMRFQDGREALFNAYANSPWLLMTFTLAFVLAVLVQDTRGAQDRRHERLRAWRDALVLALALGLAMAAVQTLLVYTRPDFEVRRFGLVFFGMGLGAFIGFYIPKRFRNVYRPDPRRQEQLRSEAHPGTLAGAWRFMKGAIP